MDAIELLDVLHPKHCRTSCSDDEPENGFESDGTFRCYRCALLEVVGMGYDWAELPENYREILQR